MTSGAATTAVRQQIAAMGCELFEVGVFRTETSGTEASMLNSGVGFEHLAAFGAMVATPES